MIKQTLLIVIIVLIFSCTVKMENPEKWNDEQLVNWFDKQEWLNGWDVNPDSSINKRSLAIAIFKNPVRWQKVFQFISSNDLAKLDIGKYEIEGENAFAIIQEYTSKNREVAKFESHQKFIDIQYVIEGEEKIGIIPAEGLLVSTPYSVEKDITFYDSEGGEYPKATAATFFVFFPEDAHRPGIKLNENSRVKKLVVKISVD